LYVFFGPFRGRRDEAHEGVPHAAGSEPPYVGCYEVHESPRVMTVPLAILATFTILLGLIGTPAWPWFQDFLSGRPARFQFNKLFESGVLGLLLVSSVVVFIGIALGWWFYGRKPIATMNQMDPLERLRPDVFALLKRKYFVDEIYDWSVVRFNGWWARTCDWFDKWVWSGAVQLVSYALLGLSWVSRFIDEYVVNLGFDKSCRGVTQGGSLMSRLQNGRVQNYLRTIGIGLTVLVLFLIWGCRS
jgi:NADH-quinone oxidoreductase subunit L